MCTEIVGIPVVSVTNVIYYDCHECSRLSYMPCLANICLSGCVCHECHTCRACHMCHACRECHTCCECPRLSWVSYMSCLLYVMPVVHVVPVMLVLHVILVMRQSVSLVLLYSFLCWWHMWHMGGWMQLYMLVSCAILIPLAPKAWACVESQNDVIGHTPFVCCKCEVAWFCMGSSNNFYWGSLHIYSRKKPVIQQDQ